MKQNDSKQGLNKKEIEAELKDYFLGKKEITAVYIFGSFVKERFNERSDLDLGVIFAEELNKLKRFKLKLKILCELEKTIAREIDLLDFEAVDLKMQHQVLDGRLICCSDQSRRVIIEKRAILNYIHMQHRYKLIDKNLGKGF